MTWGENKSGQLGDGTKEDRYVPGKIEGIPKMIAVDACGSTSAALAVDGTVWQWGYDWGWNMIGNLGYLQYGDSPVPKQVKELSDIKEFDVEGTYNVAKKNDGTIWTWPRNYTIELFDSENAVDSEDSSSAPVRDDSKPILIDCPLDVSKISAGAHYLYVLQEEGTVWSYRDVDNGSDFSKLADLNNIIDVFDGRAAIKEDGTVWTWRGNSSPVQVEGFNIFSSDDEMELEDSDVEFQLETKFNMENLEAERMLNVESTVSNVRSKQEKVLLIVALFDKEDRMVNYAFISKAIPSGRTEKLTAGFKLPSNVNDYKAKTFIWDGESIERSNMIPLSEVIALE